MSNRGALCASAWVHTAAAEAAMEKAENYHINLIIMIFTAANNYNYAKLFNNYCLLAINRNIMSFTTLILLFYLMQSECAPALYTIGMADGR